MATGDVPEDVLEVIRLGRVTALRKPVGGVRGIVVGDILRRLVASQASVEEGRSSHRSLTMRIVH